ncbi:FecCD family ABC transporter permease [Pseudomonas capsici]|uniref:Iron ABC transporter permease n=1 Tax=Pseudomonas capsici TaxID=2810614 RepID=A0ABT3BY53_9PSED|nr:MULTISPECIES: iron ABC transporter permease [Pseudomonas]MBN6715625.1 iron ABC transporter permease [Pseudomonas capsici]MBN6720658.1 iron ABC transporter permease [Pseudomonas capsici]MBN6725500.1 iron ABC transporter permease [Pseudomonas capsici]MBX8474327.1 iron ABC transporter permease [Pseudomonas cichorii]MBX8606365.1 iron ABC transporter permease [Pseudomonas cichorii]
MSHGLRLPVWLGLLMAIALAALFHLAVGAKSIPWHETWQALVAYVPDNPDHSVIRGSRLPRLLVALLVGASLGLAGTIMQAVGDNPLADPGILGINSGAALFVVFGLLVMPGNDLSMIPLFAFVGALTAAIGVLLLAGRGHNPIRLTLSGAMIAALFSAITSILLLLDQQGLDSLRRWLTGSIGVTGGTMQAWVWPYVLLGMFLCLVNVRALNAHRLGPQAAAGMGVSLLRMRVFGLASVVLLSGCAVALAGPIGFVGLVVPHAARLLFGDDYRRLLLAAPLLGALLLILADIAARTVVSPFELNTGIVTALIGGPVFVILVLRKVK